LLIDDETHEVVYKDRFNQIDWVLQKARIKEAWRRWNKGKIVLDSTGNGDSIYDDLVAMGMKVVPFKFTSSSKRR